MNRVAHLKSLVLLFAPAVAPRFVDHVDPIANDHWPVRARSSNAFAVSLAKDLLATFDRWDAEAKRPASRPKGRR